MKRIICLMALALFTLKGQAQSATKDITDKFFNKYAKDPSQAIDYAFSTNKYFDLKSEMVVSLKSKLKNVAEQCGKYHGSEQISEKSVGQNLKLVSFFVLYERQPVKFIFTFYKPNEKWQLQNFSFDADFDDELEEAVKLNVIPESK